MCRIKPGNRVLGIIAEYNPFHNGHLYHLEECKRRSGCDYVAVVLSGDFVQRGTPAFLDKYSRARFALLAGADVVFELPVCFATGSAEFFAKGAVALLHSLGIVDCLGFGCESDSLPGLKALADFLNAEPEEYRALLQDALRSGMNFPTAVQKAAASCISEDAVKLLASPNNILAVEYLKALRSFSSPIQPIPLRRVGRGYHDTTCEGDFASATAIRRLFLGDPTPATDPLSGQVPAFVYQKLRTPGFRPVPEDSFSDLLYYKLQGLPKAALTGYQDVSPELADRICASLRIPFSFSAFTGILSSKSFTASRVRRALLHILLSVTTEEMAQAAALSFAPYARLLGLRRSSAHILRRAADAGHIPIVTKPADARRKLHRAALPFLEQDIAAAALYNQVAYSHCGLRIADDYTHRLEVL